MSFYGVAPVMNESVSAVTATNSVDLGSRRHFQGNEYVYVYNAGGDQIQPGYGAVLSGVSGYSVSVSSTSQTDLLAGVCKHNTITTGAYGWLLVKGFTNVKNGMASTALVAGDILFLGVDGKFAVELTSGGTGIARNLGGAVGKVMVATASAGTGFAFIRSHI